MLLGYTIKISFFNIILSFFIPLGFSEDFT